MSDSLQTPAQTTIEELKIVSSKNAIYNLLNDLVELNIYEDMFKNCLTGTIVVADRKGLIDKLPLVGDEILIMKIRTPSFPEEYSIKKTFRIFKLSDRTITGGDANSELYTLHFASIELFYDILLPLFIPFEGTIHEVVGQIFTDYIATTRDYDIQERGNQSNDLVDSEKPTPLIILNPTANKVKFVSPGWTPFKCMNWLASKSIPADADAKNFLFFETNKAFYFGSVEHIFRDAAQNNNYIGTYYAAASNIRNGSPNRNIEREFFIARDFKIISTVDYVKNYTNGYLANRLITLDIYNKKYELVDYDYVNEYRRQNHTSGSGETSVPFFNENTMRNHATSISFYPVNPKLHDEFTENINEKMKDIYGNRLSSLLDLSNIRMVITVPGRTDVEVGNMMYFSHPIIGGRSQSDSADSSHLEDKLYSGYYLITAIHHRIIRGEHLMNMEIIKDSSYLNKEFI